MELTTHASYIPASNKIDIFINDRPWTEASDKDKIEALKLLVDQHVKAAHENHHLFMEQLAENARTKKTLHFVRSAEIGTLEKTIDELRECLSGAIRAKVKAEQELKNAQVHRADLAQSRHDIALLEDEVGMLQKRYDQLQDEVREVVCNGWSANARKIQGEWAKMFLEERGPAIIPREKSPEEAPTILLPSSQEESSSEISEIAEDGEGHIYRRARSARNYLENYQAQKKAKK